MKRTIPPIHRNKILQENITINIVKERNALKVEIKLKDLQDLNFIPNAKIILEAYSRENIARIDLGIVSEYKKETQSYDLPFKVPLRAKINFRLKIIDPKTYKILGFAEKLKEKKYAKSLLELNADDDSVKNIFKIDFDNPDHPILYLNPQLKPHAEKLKPIIAEMALKEILTHLILISNEEEDLDDHKWIKFAQEFEPINLEEMTESTDKLAWIQTVLCQFSDKNKLINKIDKIYND